MPLLADERIAELRELAERAVRPYVPAILLGLEVAGALALVTRRVATGSRRRKPRLK